MTLRLTLALKTAIATSEIKVSVLIDEDETELAVRVLNTAYGLDAEVAG